MVQLSLTMIPPSPVTDRIEVELRAGITNQAPHAIDCEVAFYLDAAAPENRIHSQRVAVGPGGNGTGKAAALSAFHWPTAGNAGNHAIIVEVTSAGETVRAEQQLTVLPLGRRSTRRIDGAFAGLLHWSEEEGRLWNQDLGRMGDEDWREMMRAQHAVGINILVIQESFRNEQYVNEHRIEAKGYQGKAFYPSELYPGRMPIGSPNPMEAILAEADQLGMSVFLPLGMYAWFDFTPGSLAWHKNVAEELWRLYGHHKSFYGWYVSEEIHGNLGSTDTHREQLIQFFAGLKAHCQAMAPEKPIMLASNCHGIAKVGDFYRRLFQHLDILCPFGFHRMPMFDLSGHDAAVMLQQWCDEAGTHLWLDLEAFLFTSDKALYPRPIDELVSDLEHYDNFEKIIAYQFPGLFNAPWARIKPGGEATVKLYLDYQSYYETLAEALVSAP